MSCSGYKKLLSSFHLYLTPSCFIWTFQYVMTHPLWCAELRSRGRWCPRWRSRCSRWNLERNAQDVVLNQTAWSDSDYNCWLTASSCQEEQQQKKNPTPGMFPSDSDLPGWFRCAGSRETEFPPGSWDPRRRPAASSRPGRGWSRWTCRPPRRTPPWEEEPEVISQWVDGGVFDGGICLRNLV